MNIFKKASQDKRYKAAKKKEKEYQRKAAKEYRAAIRRERIKLKGRKHSRKRSKRR